MGESGAAALPEEDEVKATPRADFRAGLAWMLLGGAVLVGSVTMDRLEQQNINPYTVPGLLPGLLGLAMLVLGSLLAFRGWRHGGLGEPAAALTGHQRLARKRVWTVIGLCVLYAGVMIGRGLPFWIASAVFVTGSMLILQRMDLDPEARRLTPRLWAKAIVIGLASALITQVVFQELFLVRLP